MARLLPIISWFLSWGIIISIILINVAGTVTVSNNPGYPYVFLGRTSILSITVPYLDFNPEGLALQHFVMFLNGACSVPTVYNAEGPTCKRTNTFDIHPFLEDADQRSRWMVDLPPRLWEGASNETLNIKLEPIRKVVPLVLYANGAISTAILLALTPRCFGGRRREGFLVFSVAAGSIFAFLFSSFVLTSMAHEAIQTLTTGTNSHYVSSANFGKGFVALTWGVTGASALSSVLLFAEWCMERWTPAGETTSRRWKPRGAWWLSRRGEELRAQRWGQRPSRESWLEMGPGAGSAGNAGVAIAGVAGPNGQQREPMVQGRRSGSVDGTLPSMVVLP